MKTEYFSGRLQLRKHLDICKNVNLTFNQGVTRHVQVYEGNLPVINLNELEYVRGHVYANVWPTDNVAIIDPDSGHVVGWIDLSGLFSPQTDGVSGNVLNGIAYDTENDRLFVTGKLWSTLFEIQLVLKD